MDCFVIVARKKTQIILDLKEDIPILELKRMVGGILRVTPANMKFICVASGKEIGQQEDLRLRYQQFHNKARTTRVHWASVSYLSPRILEKIEERERTHTDSHHHHHHHDHDHNDNHVRRRRALSIPGPLPDKVDWRTKGVISPVKHQKSCGACWAFSTVETVESMNALQKGKLGTLSVQQVIDCATNGNMGCNGGDTCSAVAWMTGQKLATENQYPLTLQDGTCKLRPAPVGVQVNSNYTCDNYVGAEDDLLTVLAHHGQVAVDATNWQYYVGGVIQWNCDAHINHAVQVVGYDKTSKPPHYIVRNSWGTSYGDTGYMYITVSSNLCGIAREVTSLSIQLTSHFNSTR